MTNIETWDCVLEAELTEETGVETVLKDMSGRYSLFDGSDLQAVTALTNNLSNSRANKIIHSHVYLKGTPAQKSQKLPVNRPWAHICIATAPSTNRHYGSALINCWLSPLQHSKPCCAKWPTSVTEVVASRFKPGKAKLKQGKTMKTSTGGVQGQRRETWTDYIVPNSAN